MENGVIYARYSCEKQTENSILGQVRECQEFARKSGINIIYIYKDEAISGRTATKRPAFMRMISDAASRKFNCIVVWKGDRFSRSRADAAKYKSELKKYGVRVMSATEANLTGPEAILMDGINEAFAEYFSVELAAKVERGMTQNVIEGKFNGGIVPFGYKLSQDRKVVVDERKAFIVKELFHRYTTEGVSIADLVRSFKEKGYTTNDGKYLPHSSLHNILKNPKYYGRYEFKGTVNMNFIPPLVSKETFDKAQVIMHENRRNTRLLKAKTVFYFKGKVFCEYDKLPVKCDAGTSKSGEVYYYYRCAHALEYQHPAVSIRKDELENIVFREFFNFYRNDPKREIILEKIMERFKQEQNDIEPLKTMLAETEKKLQAVVSAIENGADLDLLVNRAKELQEIREKQKKQIAERMTYEADDLEQSLRECLEYAFDIESHDNSMRMWFVTTFINKILLSDQEIIILFKYNNNFGDCGSRFNVVQNYSQPVYQFKQNALVH